MTDTVRRLREATEQLLLEQGQGRIRLRDITELAGTNVAAVNYHFGSKDALIAEVFGDVFAEATQGQRQRLERLRTEATLREVVHAWLAPALPNAITEREQRLWSVIHRGVAEGAPGLLGHIQTVQPEVQSTLLDRLAHLLPNLSPPEIAFRHAAVMAAMAALRSPAMARVATASAVPPAANLLVDWVVASFEGNHDHHSAPRPKPADLTQSQPEPPHPIS